MLRPAGSEHHGAEKPKGACPSGLAFFLPWGHCSHRHVSKPEMARRTRDSWPRSPVVPPCGLTINRSEIID